MDKKIFKFFICIMFFCFCTISVYGYVWEGFEKENLWCVSVMYGNAVNSINPVKTFKTEGAQSLEIDLGKTGSRKKGFVSREGLMDLSKVKEILFDLYIEKSVKVSVGLSTGSDWAWFETGDLKLKRGWNKNLKMNLKKKEWKSAASGWDLSVAPENLKETKKIVLVFKQGRRGKIYIDNIRFIGAKVENAAYTMPYEPLDRSKLVDDYSLLEDLSPAGWAKAQSPGVKKEGKLYSLEYSKVDNVKKAAYKVLIGLDWKEYSKLVMKIKNDSKAWCCISMGFQIGGGWVWYESSQVLLKPKSTTEVIFPLTAPTFKSEDTGWAYTTILHEKEDIVGLNFLIYGVYGKKSSGKIIIESFELMKGKPSSIMMPEEEDDDEDEDEGEGGEEE